MNHSGPFPRADVAALRDGPVLRWGVLAPGRIAEHWADAVLRHTRQRIVAVGSRDRARAASFAARHGIPRSYEGYEALVDDPGVDIVYVAAPNHLHHDLALLAIRAGKHVLVEKPLATSAAQATEIAAAASEHGVFAGEAMWSRFLPQSVVIAALLADGAFGTVRMVTCDLGVRMPPDPGSRVFDPALGGGSLLDLGVYVCWFAHAALGAPTSVSATGILADTGVDAQAALALGYAGEASSSLSTSVLVTSARHATISGTHSRLEFTGSFKDPSSFRLVSGSSIAEWTDDSGITGSGGLAYQAAAVAAQVADGLLESPEHTLRDAIEVLEVLDAASAQLDAAGRWTQKKENR